LREALQQVAVRAGDERGVGERLVVHGEVTVRDGTSYPTLRGAVLPFRANRSAAACSEHSVAQKGKQRTRPTTASSAATRSVDPRRRCGEAGAPSPLRFGAAGHG